VMGVIFLAQGKAVVIGKVTTKTGGAVIGKMKLPQGRVYTKSGTAVSGGGKVYSKSGTGITGT
jgi:hypothetical protein